MSELLDDLARRLAQPMPRRRAVGVLGVTLVSLATGGTAIGARRPFGTRQSSGCGAPYKVCEPASQYCFVHCCPKHTVCSFGPRSSRGCQITPGCCDPCNPKASTPNGSGGCAPGPVASHCGGRECKGPGNRIDAVKTPSGADYGLTGSQFRRGQTIDAQEAMALTLGDGSILKISQGTRVRLDECPSGEPSAFELLDGSIWTNIKKAVGGGQFQVSTPWGGGGVRGTTFRMSYLPARKRTTLEVFKGSVEFWARATPKRKLLVKAGQTAVQQGRGQPRITKR